MGLLFKMDTEPEHNPTDTPPETEARQSEAAGRPLVLSVVALGIGIVALGLAAIPAVATDQPLPNPFARAEPPPEPKPPEDEPKGGVTLRYKSISVTLGAKKRPDDDAEEPAPVAPPPAPEVQITKDPIRWLTIAAIGCALVGLAIAPIAQVKERHPALTVSAIGCSVAAITWQYFAIGIAIGAAAAAFLIVLAILGQLLG